MIFSQYFPPEVGATQMRLHHFASWLTAAGHDVTVVAEMPNHPKGVIFEGYRRKLIERDRHYGFDTVRVWVYTSQVKTFWRRMAFYLSYALLAAVVALTLVRRRPHVVLASSPPLPVLLPGLVYSEARRVPFVVDIRDIWPAVGVALGELRGERAIALAQRLERFFYRRAAAITCVTPGFLRHVVSCGIPADRVHLVPNGTVGELFNPERRDDATRGQLGLDGQFVVGYFGLHGIAQGLDVILDAAQQLANEPGATTFLLVGEGPVKADLQARAAELGLDNVRFHGEVPFQEVAPLINACDALVVPLRPLAILNDFVPSKVFDFMACAKPVLVLVDGETRGLVEQAGAGTFVEPGNAIDLAAAVRSMRDDPEGRRQMGQRGAAFVADGWLRDQQAEKLEGVLRSVSRL